MRIINLKSKTVAALDGEGKPKEIQVSFAKMIRGRLEAVRNPRGVSIAEVRQALRVIDACEDAINRGVDVLRLEDADWAYLCQQMDGDGWGLVDRFVVELDEAVRGAAHEKPGVAENVAA